MGGRIDSRDVVFGEQLAMKLASISALMLLALLTLRARANDTQGSPVAVADASGNVVETTEYSPYGQTLNRPVHDGPGYTGHEEDSATGLSYMQQRYYDPQSGQFISTDPVLPDGGTGASFNRYAYANGNPYRFVDPDGREQKDKKPPPPCTGSRVGCPSETKKIQVGSQSLSELRSAIASQHPILTAAATAVTQFLGGEEPASESPPPESATAYEP